MAGERIKRYECKVCGRQIDVTISGDIYEEPVYCCGVETALVESRQRPKLKSRTKYYSPDEIAGSIVEEGAKKVITVNAYERNNKARAGCLKHWGTSCIICKIDFGKKYGKLAIGFIHVHHIKSLASIGKRYRVDPKQDLVPVCPNCHSVMHMSDPPLPIVKVRELMKKAHA
jgi:predicted HNH restriction endonuclease